MVIEESVSKALKQVEFKSCLSGNDGGYEGGSSFKSKCDFSKVWQEGPYHERLPVKINWL